MSLSLSPSSNLISELHSYRSHFQLSEVRHPRKPISSSSFPSEPPSWSRYDRPDQNPPFLSVHLEDDYTHKLTLVIQIYHFLWFRNGSPALSNRYTHPKSVLRRNFLAKKIMEKSVEKTIVIRCDQDLQGREWIPTPRTLVV